MRDTKKLYVIAAVCLFVFITCIYFWPTPVRKDLRNLRSSVKIVDGYYQEITAEVETWRSTLNIKNQTLAVNSFMSELQYGVNQVIIPKTKQAVAVLELTELTTPEVIAIRDEIIDSLTLYSAASEQVLDALKKNDRKVLDEAEQTMNQATQAMERSANDFRTLARKNHYIYFD